MAPRQKWNSQPFNGSEERILALQSNWVMILVLGSKGLLDRECLVRLLLCANSISYYFWSWMGPCEVSGKMRHRGVVSGGTFTTHLGWSFIQWCFKAIGISLQDCALCIWITTLFWSFSAYNWKESYPVSTSQNFLHFPWVRLFSLLWWYQHKQSSRNLYN